MEKKTYVKPVAEKVDFDCNDCIATSGCRVIALNESLGQTNCTAESAGKIWDGNQSL